MINKKKVLAIIPARGGSKALPNKNLQLFFNKPLVSWSIESALSCDIIDRVVVSSDSKKVLEVAAGFGSEIPMRRPQELSSDTASTIDVIFHVVDELKKKENFYPFFILLLQPTSPLRRISDIVNSFQILQKYSAQAIISVCKTEHHPWWTNTLPDDCNMKNFLKPDIKNKCRQELPVFYRLNGAIYLSEIKYLYKNYGFFGPATFAYKMPIDRSVDIDYEIDLKIAAFLYKEKKKFEEE